MSYDEEYKLLISYIGAIKYIFLSESNHQIESGQWYGDHYEKDRSYVYTYTVEFSIGEFPVSESTFELNASFRFRNQVLDPDTIEVRIDRRSFSRARSSAIYKKEEDFMFFCLDLYKQFLGKLIFHYQAVLPPIEGMLETLEKSDGRL